MLSTRPLYTTLLTYATMQPATTMKMARKLLDFDCSVHFCMAPKLVLCLEAVQVPDNLATLLLASLLEYARLLC